MFHNKILLKKEKDDYLIEIQIKQIYYSSRYFNLFNVLIITYSRNSKNEN